MAALVPDDREELLVGVMVDEGRVDHDEGLVVRPVGGRVEARVRDDVDLGRRDVQRVGATLRDALDAWELPIGDAHSAAEELVLEDLLPHAHGRGDGHLDGLGALERRARLPVGDVRVFVARAVDQAARRDALRALARDEGVEIKRGSVRHGN